MSFMLGLRILAVVMLGLVVAQSTRSVLMSIAGHHRLSTRVLLSEVLTGLGAFVIGWGLLPGGAPDSETTITMIGILVWVLGILTGPPARSARDA